MEESNNQDIAIDSRSYSHAIEVSVTQVPAYIYVAVQYYDGL